MHHTKYAGHRACLPAAALLALSGQCFAAGASGNTWVFTANGEFAVNPAAHLAWTRCVQGMTWNGQSCVGRPNLLSHVQAQDVVQARRKSDGVTWRLPTVLELQHMREQANVQKKLFPGAPPGWYWSSSAKVTTESANQYNYANVMRAKTNPGSAQPVIPNPWVVNLSTGEALDEGTKRWKLPVLLVTDQF